MRVFPSPPISANSGATSNGWDCSAISRCWASSRASGIATASPATSKIQPASSPMSVRLRSAMAGSRRLRNLLTGSRRGRRASDTPSRADRPPMFGAMILAAGRGERMRPLSDQTPKPLLRVGGKPLIVWQIEALARAGFCDLVINASHHANQLIDFLNDGAAWGVRIKWSIEATPLETAGGVATASTLLAPGPALIVSGDIWTAFDYSTLIPRAETMARDPLAPRVHLVMVPNPPYHVDGDFALRDGMLSAEGDAKLVYGNIGLHDTALFRELPRGVPLRLLPLWRDWMARGLVSGESFEGAWANVGTPADLAALDAQLMQSPRTSGQRIATTNQTYR